MTTRDKTILLVEDNQDDELLMIRALEKNRIANPIRVARDGIEALEYMFGEGTHEGRDVGDTPMLVLLDLKLPRLSGLEVLKRVRADVRTQRTPIVVLTTSREESDLAATYDAGVNSFVRKPVDFLEFTEAVRQLGLYWLVLNEPPPAAR